MSMLTMWQAPMNLLTSGVQEFCGYLGASPSRIRTKPLDGEDPVDGQHGNTGDTTLPDLGDLLSMPKKFVPFLPE